MSAGEWWAIASLTAISAASVVVVWWVYDGYGRVLSLLPSRRDGPDIEGDGEAPAVSVLLTVHNEQSSIEHRLANLLESDYPSDRLEVVVASDHSTDRTNEIVEAWSSRDPRVRLLAFDSSRGKSDAQNRALESIAAPIVVFTDADTRFSPECIRRLVAPFADPRVGGTDAELHFEQGDGVAVSFSRYWRYERRIRALESKLGLLAVASGACVAVRRSLIKPIPLDVGEDCVLPLMVVSQGRRMVVAEGALAWDRAATDAAREFRARVRMTLRNWRGTWAYPALLNPIASPALAWSLWSHKLLRWLTLPLLAAGTIAGFAAVAVAAPMGWLIDASVLVAGGIVLATPWPGRPLRHFLLANLAFAVGVAKALTGIRMTEYRAASAGRGVGGDSTDPDGRYASMPASDGENLRYERVMVLERPAGDAITLDGLRKALSRQWWVLALAALASVVIGAWYGSIETSSARSVMRMATLPKEDGVHVALRTQGEAVQVVRETILPVVLGPVVGPRAASRMSMVAGVEVDSTMLSIRFEDVPMPAAELAAVMSRIEESVLAEQAAELQNRREFLEAVATEAEARASETQQRILEWRELDSTTAQSSFDQTIAQLELARDAQLASASEAMVLSKGGRSAAVLIEAATEVEAARRGIVPAAAIVLVGSLIFGPVAALAVAVLRGGGRGDAPEARPIRS